MGGSALRQKGLETSRLDTAAFLSLRREIIERADRHGLRLRPIPFYSSKPDHGDMDLLCLLDGDEHMRDDILDVIHEEFKPTHLVRNGEVISFNVDAFQIDFILIEPALEPMSILYFSWNDAGNLMGRLAHQVNLKLGHTGLYLPVRDPGTNHVIDEILISQDPAKILNFLGLSASDYARGFETREAIFEWLSTSRFFHRRMLLRDSENTKHRKRDHRRPTYHLFTSWLEANYERLPAYAAVPLPEENKPPFELLWALFPEARVDEKHDSLLERMKLMRYARQKFSGDQVRALLPTTLSDREFGVFMAKWRNRFSDQDALVQHVLQTPIETLNTEVLDFFRQSA